MLIFQWLLSLHLSFSFAAMCFTAGRLLLRATLSFWLKHRSPLGLRLSGTGEVFPWYFNTHTHTDVDVLLLSARVVDM